MYIPLNWQIDRVLSVHRFARVWFSTRGASNEQFLPLLLRSINELLANPFRTLIPIWCPEFRFERCYFHVISRSSSRYYSKGEDQTFRLGFIFQRSNFERSSSEWERLTRLTRCFVSISFMRFAELGRNADDTLLLFPSGRRLETVATSRCFDAVYIIISLETPSFRLIRVHARPYKLAQATKSAPLIDSRLARDRSDHVSIFQIHISLPRGNYLATAGRSLSFENSNFQSFIDISFAKSSIFSRKMVESVVYAG